MDILKSLHRWCERRLEIRAMKEFGGIQWCTWCRQVANQNGKWTIEEWKRDPMLDVLTCGVCGGESLWRFEMGMIFIAPLTPPKPQSEGVKYYSVEDAALSEAR